MADSRDALFGGASKRNAGKVNPYANIAAQPGDASAPAAAPAPAPKGPQKGSNSQSVNAPASSDDDPNRAMLLAGGKKRVAAPEPQREENIQQLQVSEMFEGDLEFHFEDLNLTGMNAGSAAAQGADGVDGELDFAAIDTDMQRFEKDEVIREALARGVDLRQYSKQVEGELHSLELRSIADYVAESDNIASLFEQICGCESVLTTMQGLLQGFQDNLGGISDEIRSLQEESLALSVRMQNRKALNGKIKAFLARVAVSEALVGRVVDGEVNEAWLRDLRALAEKVEFISGAYKMGSALPTRAEGLPLPALPADELGAGSYADSLSELTVNPFETPAGRDAVPQVERLRHKAVQRVREFLLRSIGEVARPQLKTNMQKQQEYILLKFAYAQAFLSAHGPDAAKEVRATYAEGVSRVYGEVFKTYAAELGRLALPPANKNDVIGNFDPSAHGAATASASASAAAASVGAARPSDPFSIADRMPLLAEVDAPPIPLHVAQAEKSRMPFEAAFRSVQRHLADVAGSETTFCHKFFGAKDGPAVYSASIGKATAAALEMVEAHVSSAWDGPGLLLMLALTTAHRRSLSDRVAAGGTTGSTAAQRAAKAKAAAAAASAAPGQGTAPATPPSVPHGPLDAYFDRIAMLLWPRFKLVFDANLQSIKGATSKKVGAGEPGSAHPATRRFADFTASLLSLHGRMVEMAAGLPGAGVIDEMLPTHVLGLTREMEALWGRLAAELTAAGGGAGKGLPKAAFMLHQYAVVLAASSERGLEASSSSASSHVSVGHGRATSQFVDETVDAHFRVLTTFIRKVEVAAAGEAKAKGMPVPPMAGALSSDAAPSSAPSSSTGIISFLPDGLIPPAEPAETEAIVRDFALNWRSGLSGLNEDVTKYFGRDVRAAMAVLKAAFSRFVEVHGRLTAIVARGFPANPVWARELVPLQTIYFEMRRYGRATE